MQIFFAGKLELWQVIPNFTIAFVIFINFKYSLNLTSAITFILGLCIDLNDPLHLGLNTLLLLIIGYLVNRYHQAVNKKVYSSLISILLLNTVYYLLFIIFSFNIENLSWQIILHWAISVIYNSFISLIILHLLFILRYIRVEIVYE